MTVAPVVGAGLGALLGAVLVALTAAGAPSLVAAAVTVAAGALLTRGLHLDGLADTVDALGSYRSGPAALEIMKKPDIGPFGVAAHRAGPADSGRRAGRVGGPGLEPLGGRGAGVRGRAARGHPGLPPRGAGGPAGRAGRAGRGNRADAGRGGRGGVPSPWRPSGRCRAGPWQGPLAVVAALATVALLVRHAVRRFGGITGDVLGAAVELATTVALLALVLGSG